MVEKTMNSTTAKALISDSGNPVDIHRFLQAGALLALDENHLFLGQGPTLSQVCDTTRPSIYAPDFFMLSKNPWLVFEQTCRVEKSALAAALLDQPQAAWRVTEEKKADRAVFEAYFDRIQAGFDAGKWRKVVPYSASYFKTTTGPAQIVRALLRLLDLPGELAPYGFWSPSEGILGATPELLIRKTGQRVTSLAMAGTRPRASAQAPLLSDAKQLAEHRIVLEDIEAVLRRFGKIHTEPTIVTPLRYLEHLSAPISLDLNESTRFVSLIRALHPTPALGASPRGSADELLRELDAHAPRGRFGAPFALRNPDDDGVCVVAIRNVQWRFDTLQLAAGCGIVPASRFDDEWQELLEKQSTIRRHLGL
ncbi:MAG: chorismate-binding protein [Myxococcota bacterium]|nr:chorismate-binding protein [Myxococcota bacterium]